MRDIGRWRYGAARELLIGWAAALAVLLVAAVAFGGPIKGPTEITVEAGRLKEVPLIVDGDEIEYAILGGESFGGFREFSDPKTFRFQVLGYQNGTGFIVISSAKAGKLQPIYVVKVVVGNGPPKPPPPIDPPTPDDPALATIVANLKVAAIADRWHQSNFTACAKGFDAAAAAVRAGGTVASVMAALKSAMGAALNKQEVSPTVYPIFSAQINATLGTTASDPVDGPTAAKLFLRLSKACERAAK